MYPSFVDYVYVPYSDVTLFHQSVCGSWGCVFWETPSKIWVKRPTEQAESQEADQSGYLICYNKICFCTGKFDSLGLFSVFLGWSQIYGRVLYASSFGD